MSMKRREFLNASLLAAASAMGVQLYGVPFNLAHASTAQKKKLFVIFLRGGFDGLLAVPSASNFTNIKNARPDSELYMASEYERVRNQDFRHHKDLDIFSLGGIALFPHAGSLNSTRSHFEQQDYIEGGKMDRIERVGYLSRAATISGMQLDTAAVGGFVPQSLKGPADPLQVTSYEALQAIIKTGNSANPLAQSSANLGLKERLRYISSKEELSECPEKSRACLSAHGAVGIIDKLNLPADTTNDPYDLAAAISLTQFAPQIITIDVGGWDVHDEAYSRMTGNDGLLNQLSVGLKKLKSRLGNEWNNSAVVVMSEFGRTLQINGNKGFDHGRGGLMMVLGGKIKPPSNNAFINKWDLSQTEGTGASKCLAVKTDYRDVMAHLLIDHLGLPQNKVLTDVFPNFSSKYKKPGIV